MKSLCIGYFLLVLVVSQSNEAFDDVTGSPTVGGQPRQTIVTQQNTNPQIQPNVMAPQSTAPQES